MKRLLIALLLGLPAAAHSATGFGGTGTGFGANVEYIIENGTFTLNGSWDYSGASGISGATVATSVPVSGDGSDGSPVTIEAGAITSDKLADTFLESVAITGFGLQGDGTAGTPLQLTTSCSSQQILKYNGGGWSCSADESGGGGGGGNGAHQFYRDDFTSLADGIETDFVMTTTAADNSPIVSLDGINQQEGLDYTITFDPPTISFNTAPTAQTTSLFVVYASSLPVVDLDATYGNQRMMSVSVGASVNGATYEVMKRFMYPGSDLAGEPFRVLSNEYKSSGGGSCDFRIYDATNALVIHSSLGITATDPLTIANEIGFSNVDTAPAVWEYQGKRNGGGTVCEADYLTLVWQ